MNTRRMAILVVVIIIYGLFLVGCSPVKKSKTAEVKTIGDIAYDVNRKHGYTAYVEEGSLFVPYLVLTNDYEGNTLLLRRDLLEEPMKFNDYFSYYEDSYIDKYLNKDFKSSFSADIQKAMVTTRILITKESSLGNGGEGIKGIKREVFLLSCSEIGMSDYSVAGKEGKALKYFPDGDSRIAYVKEKAGSWLLRTPNTSEYSCSYGIGPEGTLGSGNAYDLSGVRPAFCVKKTMPIRKNYELIKGKSVYVFTFNK